MPYTSTILLNDKQMDEKDLIKTLNKLGMGCIVFSPLAQGMLSEKYIKKIPKISRANENSSLSPNLITKTYKEKIINLKKIAAKRNQTVIKWHYLGY